MAILWRGVITVAGAFLVHLTLGTIGSDGNVVPYIISYVHERVDTSASISYTAFVGTLHAASNGILIVPSGYLATKIGYRLTIFISSITLSGAVALTYFSIRISFVLVLLTYAFLNGLGGSIGYGNAVACCIRWFPNRRGMTGGIVVAGFGLGAFVFNPLQTILVNPHNVSPTKDGYFVDSAVLDRLPFALLHLATVYLIIQIIGCLMISEPPDVDKPEDSSTTTNLTPLQTLRTKEFYILWAIMFCNCCVMMFCNAMYKAYGQTFIHDDEYLAFVGSIMSALNALGRLLWGSLLDRYTYVPCARTVTTGMAVLMLTMPATKAVGGKAFYTVWSGAVYFFVAGTFSLTPAICATIFGTKHLAANYGMIYASGIVSGIMVAGLSAFLNEIGYVVIFFILGGVNVIGIVMTFAFEHVTRRKDLPNSKDLNVVNEKHTNKLAMTNEIDTWAASYNRMIFEQKMSDR